MQTDEGDRQNEASRETDAETPTRDDPRPDNPSDVVESECEKVDSNCRSDPGIVLICISGGGEFESVRTWCDAVTKVT